MTDILTDTVHELVSDSLVAEAVKLATLREELAQREAQYRERKASFDLATADLRQRIEATKRAIEASDSALRALAQLETDRTGNTEPCPGVTVVRTTEVRITYDAGAFAWAKASGIGYVPEGFDPKAVTSAVMKAGLTVPFVASEERYAVRVASDLPKALGALYSRSGL